MHDKLDPISTAYRSVFPSDNCIVICSPTNLETELVYYDYKYRSRIFRKKLSRSFCDHEIRSSKPSKSELDNNKNVVRVTGSIS
jgi:hypothetical protein